MFGQMSFSRTQSGWFSRAVGVCFVLLCSISIPVDTLEVSVYWGQVNNDNKVKTIDYYSTHMDGTTKSRWYLAESIYSLIYLPKREPVLTLSSNSVL